MSRSTSTIGQDDAALAVGSGQASGGQGSELLVWGCGRTNRQYFEDDTTRNPECRKSHTTSALHFHWSACSTRSALIEHNEEETAGIDPRVVLRGFLLAGAPSLPPRSSSLYRAGYSRPRGLFRRASTQRDVVAVRSHHPRRSARRLRHCNSARTTRTPGEACSSMLKAGRRAISVNEHVVTKRRVLRVFSGLPYPLSPGCSQSGRAGELPTLCLGGDVHGGGAARGEASR